MSKTWGELLVFDKRREVSFGLNQLEFAENEGLENQVSFIPLHPNISGHILHTVLNTGAEKENLFNNQELLSLVIISFFLVTFTCDFGIVKKNLMLVTLGVKEVCKKCSSWNLGAPQNNNLL